MSSFKINFTLDPVKAIRKTAEYFFVNFPLDLRVKKLKLTIKVTKQKQAIKKKLYIKLSTVLSRNSRTFFIFLFCTYSVGLTTMIL